MSNEAYDQLMALFTDTDSLTRQLSVEEAESTFAVLLKDFSPTPIPFGYHQPEWKKLKSKTRKGDEIWEFETRSPRGDRLRGVKLLRSGKVIDSIVAEVTPPKDARPDQPMFGIIKLTKPKKNKND